MKIWAQKNWFTGPEKYQWLNAYNDADKKMNNRYWDVMYILRSSDG